MEYVSLPRYIVAGWDMTGNRSPWTGRYNAIFCACSPMFENLTLRADVMVVSGIESNSFTSQQTARLVLSVEDGDTGNDLL